jgi:Domain of unknown function (DUF4440)
MKIRFSLLVCSALVLSAFNLAFAQSKADPATSKVVALEAKWNEAYKRNDPAGMEALLADDFIITGEDGTTFSKSGYLAHTADSETASPNFGHDRYQSPGTRHHRHRHGRLSRERHIQGEGV